MYQDIQKKILYLNQTNKKLFYVNNNELIEISSNLLDNIQDYSKYFKIITACNYPITNEIIKTEEDLKSIFVDSKDVINYYGFQPKVITQKDLSNLSQIELSVFGEGYSYFNTESNLLFFLKRSADGKFYWSKGENLVGLPGPKGQKGETGIAGKPGEKGEPGVQGPALGIDFVFPRPIDDLIVSQVALNKIGENKFVFCSQDGKIYTTMKENNKIILSKGYNFIGKEGPKGEKGDKGDRGEKGEDGQNAQVISINEFINFDPKNKTAHEISQYEIGYTFMNLETGLIHIVASSNGYKYISNGIPLAGPRGPKGDKGEKGIQGERGEAGIMGLPGPPGSQGQQGKRGEMGPAFNPNKIGNKLPQNFTQNEIRMMGEGYAYLCTDNGLMYFVEKENEFYKFSNGFQIKGPKGDIGPQGEKGENGDRGIQGTQGPIGPKGEKGEKGDKGDKGDKGERGMMGIQGPGYNPDFKVNKDPNLFSLEELETYGEGTSLLCTIDGNLYFIQKIDDRLCVSKGFPIVGVQGERGIQGEKGDIGPRGMVGQPGKPGDSYLNYNDNRNLSYHKGGFAIGKETEVLENETLRIGNRDGKTTSIIIENTDGNLIEEKYQFPESNYTKNIELNDGITLSYISKEKLTKNYFDKLIINNVPNQEIKINCPIKVENIIGNNINIQSNECQINNWSIREDNIKCNGIELKTKNNFQLLFNEKEILRIDEKFEIFENTKISNLEVNNIKFDELIMNCGSNIAKFNKDEIEFQSKSIKINNLRIVEDNNVTKINDNIIINDILQITDNIKYTGEKFEITHAIIDKLDIGDNKFDSNQLSIKNNIFSIKSDIMQLVGLEFIIDSPKMKYDFNKFILKNIGIQFTDVNLELTTKTSKLEIKNNLLESNFNCKFTGDTTFTNNTYFLNSNISLEKSQLNIENSLVKIDNTNISIKGQININENINISNNLLLVGDQKIIFSNSDIYYKMSDNNWLNVKNDNFILNGMNFIISSSIFNSNKSEIKINSSTVSVNDKSEIKISDKISILNDTIKLNNTYTTFENSRIMIGGYRLIITDENIDFTNYEVGMKDIKLVIKNKKSDLLLENEDITINNFRVNLIGELSINNSIISKKGILSIYDNEINLDNSKINIGQNIKIAKDNVSFGQINFLVENSDVSINNCKTKLDKIELDINGSIDMKNTKLNYYSEGILRLSLENHSLRLLNTSINIKDSKIKINDNLAIVDNKLVNSNFEWLLKDVKIDFQEGKLAINPNFTKLKTYKIVLEESCFLYKDSNSMLLLEKETFYSSNLHYKLKDNSLEWIDKNGNQVINLSQNSLDLNKINIKMKSSIIFLDKNEIKLNNSEIGISGGNIVLEDYRLLDGSKTFIIKPGNWEWNSCLFLVNKSNYKLSSTNIERVFGNEKNKNIEVEYTKCKFNWNDEKNRSLLFMGDKSAQFNFPVMNLNNDIIFKNGDNLSSFTQTGWKIENTTMLFINSKFSFEKNGFPILTITGDDIVIKNSPLKIQDTYFSYIYEKKNAQLLIKNDIFYSNYIDYEIRNGSINWNHKLTLSGNSLKANELQIEIVNSPIIIKNNKSRIEIVESIEIEDFPIKVKNLKNDLLSIEKNTVKLEGNLFLKNSRLYNECLTLESNLFKIVQAQQKFKQNDIFYEECYLELDQQSHIKIGDWEINSENKTLSFTSGKSSVSVSNKVEYKFEDQKIGIGGIDKFGNNILIDSGTGKIIEKDGEIYFRLGKSIDLNKDYVTNMGDEKYVNQLKLIMDLMARVEKLEKSSSLHN